MRLDTELDIPLTCTEIGKEVAESNVRFESINMDTAVLYVAHNFTRGEVCDAGLQDLIPARQARPGRPKGMANKEMTARVKQRTGQHGRNLPDGWSSSTSDQTPTPPSTGPGTGWFPPRRAPKSDAERRLIVAKVLESACGIVMKNHVYTFGGRKYKQIKGGAIGLRLTGVVARIRMDRWARRAT